MNGQSVYARAADVVLLAWVAVLAAAVDWCRAAARRVARRRP